MLALSVSVVAAAQSNQLPAANAILVSQTRDGNVVTTRYKIPHDHGKQAEFDVHYAINRSDVVTSYSDNSQQIADLKDFMEQTKDSTMHISAIHIVGYASPDGNTKHNDSLAAHRAQALYNFAVRTFHPKQKIDTAHKTFHWSDCIPVVKSSSMPQKDAVLKILASATHSELQKEAALKAMPEAWSYFATNVLPQMRYADIGFDYGVDEFVTRTTTVEQSEPAKNETPTQSQTQSQQSTPVVVEEEVGIIVATPVGHEAERNEKREERKEERKDKKDNRKGEVEVIYW